MDKNKKLLNEELNRFKLMTEYAFYEDRGEEEDVLDGDVEAPTDDFGDASDEISQDLEGGDDMSMDDPEALDLDDTEAPVEPEAPIEPEMPEEDEVELDVTELVQGTEEAKQSADAANAKMEELMGMVSKLEGQISQMDNITNKIDGLAGEMEKRMPTDNEKLEMRSLDSAPYNLKLTDFWSQQEGKYDIMDQEGKEKEYVLTKDEIDGDYSDSTLKDSFDNPYEEEEI